MKQCRTAVKAKIAMSPNLQILSKVKCPTFARIAKIFSFINFVRINFSKSATFYVRNFDVQNKNQNTAIFGGKFSTNLKLFKDLIFFSKCLFCSSLKLANLMFKTKITHISRNFLAKNLAIAALILFVASQAISLTHSLSHQGFSAFAKESVLAKIFFAHGAEKNSGTTQHCFVCAIAEIQNHFFASPNLVFLPAVFYLIFFTRNFNRVKLAYLRSSNTSRAPPANS